MSSVMNGESLSRHMKTVQAAGYPPAQTERAIQLIVYYASGKEAEAALSELLERLPASSLSHLVDVYLNPHYAPSSNSPAPDWLEDPATVAGFLATKKIEVVEGTAGWDLMLPDRTKLVQQYRESETAPTAKMSRAEALVRVGLKAAWLVRLRAKPASTRPTDSQYI
jgi:hypothetical protein